MNIEQTVNEYMAILRGIDIVMADVFNKRKEVKEMLNKKLSDWVSKNRTIQDGDIVEIVGSHNDIVWGVGVVTGAKTDLYTDELDAKNWIDGNEKSIDILYEVYKIKKDGTISQHQFEIRRFSTVKKQRDFYIRKQLLTTKPSV